MTHDDHLTLYLIAAMVAMIGSRGQRRGGYVWLFLALVFLVRATGIVF